MIELPPMTGRLWTVDHPCKVLTMNEARRLHWAKWAAYIDEIREVFGWLGATTRVRFARVIVVVTPLHRKGTTPQDVSACTPATKPAIDGLVDARVIPADDPAHVLAIIYTTPAIADAPGLRLTLHEVEPA